MEAEILIFTANSGTFVRTIEFDPLSAVIFSELKERQKVTVCLIEGHWLVELEKYDSNFIYKGLKHPKKQLSYYFNTKNEQIGFIDGRNYKVYSQLKRSIRDFMNRATQSEKNAVFIIGVSDSLYKNAKDELTSISQQSEVKKGRYKNPLLNLINKPYEYPQLRSRYMGNSEPCMLVRQMIAIAAHEDFPVLILGESGTGKEVVARNIHECSRRAGKPFIAINCGAIPSELFESELFGYIKGSSSIAFKDKKGLWEAANNGTLFLDEIGDLSLNHQVKILRALTEEEILPVGGTRSMKMNVRIIAATNRNIEVLASEKDNRFREDLYYRISTFIIRTPPLRSHPEDIPELVEKTWAGFSKIKLPHEVLIRLQTMNWPGNVRSLKHFLQRLYVLFGNQSITEEHISVLQQQELENYIDLKARRPGITNQPAEKEFEKAIMRIEYLLKASVYTEDQEKRKALLENARDCIEELS